MERNVVSFVGCWMLGDSVSEVGCSVSWRVFGVFQVESRKLRFVVKFCWACLVLSLVVHQNFELAMF